MVVSSVNSFFARSDHFSGADSYQPLADSQHLISAIADGRLKSSLQTFSFIFDSRFGKSGYDFIGER